jgi:hypothetical protein
MRLRPSQSAASSRASVSKVVASTWGGSGSPGFTNTVLAFSQDPSASGKERRNSTGAIPTDIIYSRIYTNPVGGR